MATLKTDWTGKAGKLIKVILPLTKQKYFEINAYYVVVPPQKNF